MDKKKLSKSKGLKALDVFLGMICLIFFVDTIAPMAAMGVSSISWCVIIAVMFYIPTGLITAELATTYPEEGGMYNWIKRAYGKRWGARVSWMYWVNNAIWTASVAVFFVGVLSTLFFPNISFLIQLILMALVILTIIGISLRSVDESKLVANAASIVKLVLATCLIICGIVFLTQNSGESVSSFAWSEMKPTIRESMTYMPALIYNFLGFEALMTLTGHMKNPKRDIPRFTVLSSLLVASMYILTSMSMLIILPANEINIVTGTIDVFFIVMGSSIFGKIIIYTIGCLLLFTVIGQTSTWLLTACRMAASASDDNELPKIFGKRHKEHDCPIGGLQLMAIIGVALVALYGFMASTAEDLFWTLFAFTNVIYLFTFIINYQGFIKLRKVDKETVRPFIFPGPKWLAWCFAHICQIILIFTVVLFFWVPGYGMDWSYSIPLGIGIILSLILGEYLTSSSIKKGENHKLNG